MRRENDMPGDHLVIKPPQSKSKSPPRNTLMRSREPIQGTFQQAGSHRIETKTDQMGHQPRSSHLPGRHCCYQRSAGMSRPHRAGRSTTGSRSCPNRWFHGTRTASCRALQGNSSLSMGKIPTAAHRRRLPRQGSPPAARPRRLTPRVQVAPSNRPELSTMGSRFEPAK